ncbi:MAG: DUF86 domain-containing protein [Fibrobacterota bacterium]
MSKRSASLLSVDMMEAAESILSYTAGLSIEGFRKDKKTFDAVVRNFEILGEAARLFPENSIEANPEIAWRQIAALRNRIIHEYFGVDAAILWQIVQNEIPKLKEQLKTIKI